MEIDMDCGGSVSSLKLRPFRFWKKLQPVFPGV
jgi:hypothetical protein